MSLVNLITFSVIFQEKTFLFLHFLAFSDLINWRTISRNIVFLKALQQMHDNLLLLYDFLVHFSKNIIDLELSIFLRLLYREMTNISFPATSAFSKYIITFTYVMSF